MQPRNIHKDSVVTVTLASEVAPGHVVTTRLSPSKLLGGLFFTPSAEASYLAEERRFLHQCFSHRALRRR